MGPSWTTEQKHAYTTARGWARPQLLPWAVADTYATWCATVGRNLFTDAEDAFDRWMETPEYLRHWGPVTRPFGFCHLAVRPIHADLRQVRGSAHMPGTPGQGRGWPGVASMC